MAQPPVLPEDEWRDFVVPGNRLSGLYQPRKSGIRLLLRWILDRLEALAAATGIDPQIIIDLQTGLTRLSSGFLGPLAMGSSGGEALSGSALITVNGTVVGIRIPAGQSGYLAYVFPRYPLSFAYVASLVGRVVRIRLLLNVTANFNKDLTISARVWTPTESSINRALQAMQILSPTATTRVLNLDYLIRGDETDIAFISQVTSTSTLGAESSFQIADTSWSILSTPTAYYLSAPDESSLLNRDFALRDALAVVNAQAAVGGYAKTVTVKPDGTGNFTTPRAALASITDASASKRYEVLVYPGVYNENQLTTKDYVDIRGTDRQRCIIRGYQAPSTAPAQIAANSTIQMDTETTLSNLTVTAQNMRYAIHSDSFGALRDRHLRVIDCHLEHYGNDEARAYVTSQGGDPNTIWSTPHAWGIGTSSGQRFTADRSTIASPTGGWYHHNNVGFTKPNVIRLIECRLITRSGGSFPAVTVQNLGSGTGDVLEMIGCQANGYLEFNPFPWLTDDQNLWIADRPHLQRIIGHGNTPMPYLWRGDGARALRIDGARSVSGDAVPLILGEAYSEKGGGGLQAAVYGRLEVGGAPTGASQQSNRTPLGVRLGNRSSSNRTLTVVTEGGATINIVFNQDFSGQSNAAVVTFMNNAGSGAITFSLMDVAERWRPFFADEEIYVRNDDTVAIRRKQAVAYASAADTVRLMTSTDPATRFAGIAYENIPPGEWGRVKSRGAVRVAMDMDRTDSAAFVFGDTFGVGSTPGRWVKGATIPLVTAINALDVRWGNKIV